MKRRTFNPQTPGQKIDSEEIISKGVEIYQVDISTISALLDSLVPYANTPIRNLTGEAKKNYETIVTYVRCFYENGTYDALHQVIVSKFPPANNLIPGTVGAYMVGCLANSDTCSPLCVGAAPASASSKPCQERVILANQEGTSYSFSPLNNIADPQAVLYLPQTNAANFSGLSASEKDALAGLGVKSAYIKGYNGNRQVDLSNGYMALDALPLRENDLPTPVALAAAASLGYGVGSAQANSSNKSSYNVAYLLLVVVIILILLFVAWKVWWS